MLPLGSTQTSLASPSTCSENSITPSVLTIAMGPFCAIELMKRCLTGPT